MCETTRDAAARREPGVVDAMAFADEQALQRLAERVGAAELRGTAL